MHKKGNKIHTIGIMRKDRSRTVADLHLKSLRRVAEVGRVLAAKGLLSRRLSLIKPGGVTKKPLAHAQIQQPPLIPIAIGLRQACEELGPTFIKLGQLLSTRTDLVEPKVAQELSKLQDRVPVFEQELVAKLIAEELGATPESLFASFDYHPLASASIAQVHRATLKTGEQVVLKLQRPNLAGQVEQDLLVLRMLQPVVKRTLLSRICKYPQVVDQLERQLNQEMDFYTEALNVQQFGQALQRQEQILVPGVHWPFTTKQILTLDYIQGQSLDAYLADGPTEEESCRQAKQLIRAVVEPFFSRGVFHGDPHPGNLLFTPKGELALLDYGIVGRLDESFQHQAALLLTALKKSDTALLTRGIIALGEVTQEINEQLLFEDASKLLEQARGVNQGQVAFGQVINSMIKMAINHGIMLPNSFFLLGKSLYTTEGVVKKLAPQLNFLDQIYPLAEKQLSGQLRFDAQKEQLLLASLFSLRELQALPGQMLKFLAKVATGNQQLPISLREGERIARAVQGMGHKIWEGAVVLGLLVSGTSLVTNSTGGPQLGLGGFMVAVAGILILRGLGRNKLGAD